MSTTQQSFNRFEDGYYQVAIKFTLFETQLSLFPSNITLRPWLPKPFPTKYMLGAKEFAND